jgi:glyoxylase-like metal-dependent hydrolase (beta-lactamase superfamily II)
MREQITNALFAIGLFFTLAMAAQGQPAQNQPQAGPPPELVKVKDDIYIVQNRQHIGAEIQAYGGNATIFLTDDGVVLVDSKNDREHDDLIAKIKSLTAKPIKYVILTHNHGDHSAGAPKLKALGATVIISAADRDNMARTNQAFVPDFGFIGQAELTLGGKKVEMYQFRGHTRGDAIVYFPASRVVVLGDLLTTAETIPMIVNYPDGGSWSDWSISMDQILRMDFETAIPGHGPMVTKSQVAELRNKMVTIRERVRAMNREKKTQEEIQQTLVKEFNWGFGGSAGNIAGMMQELR